MKIKDRIKGVEQCGSVLFSINFNINTFILTPPKTRYNRRLKKRKKNDHIYLTNRIYRNMHKYKDWLYCGAKSIAYKRSTFTQHFYYGRFYF